MVDVKPDEISAILKQQLSGFKTETELEEVGTVLQVGDGIARVFALNFAICLGLSLTTLGRSPTVLSFSFHVLCAIDFIC